jgi:hypothetical protein
MLADPSADGFPSPLLLWSYLASNSPVIFKGSQNGGKLRFARANLVKSVYLQIQISVKAKFAGCGNQCE